MIPNEKALKATVIVDITSRFYSKRLWPYSGTMMVEIE
jgi:hypothetical protein